MNYIKPPIELFVEKMIPGGLGLARLEGQVVLLPQTLPGEKVLATVGQSGRGQVVEVLEPSPHRREPDCPWSGQCGGCDFLQVDPEVALKFKSQAELGDLSENFRLEVDLVESPRRERYRSRAIFHLGKKTDGKLGVGFYDHRRTLVEPEDCRLLDPALTRCLPTLRGWADTLPEAADGLEISLTKDLITSEVAACITISPSAPHRRRFSPPLLVKLKASLKDALAKDGLTEPTPLGPVTAIWPQWNLTLRTTTGGFTQVNPEVNQLLVEKILALAEPLATSNRKQALDLYSGQGNIALPLAMKGFTVTAVENSPPAVKAARHNGRGQTAFTILDQDSKTAVMDLTRKGRKFDLVILDPPRAGAQDLAPAIATLTPEIIIYVACHPAVLYRDLPALISLGYQPESLIALDMFPRTSHLESLAVLRRR